ncbi:MAG: DUF58 domain-containing protein [Deltaproteobacteria bacterium]|nr:DUF58 domain-containing protein [Deltaproteobacteria bacterium]
MAPTRRMVLWSALVFAPAAGLWWTSPSEMLLPGAVAALFLLAAAADAAASARRLSGVSVASPEAVRLFRGRASDVALTVSSSRGGTFALGLDLPGPFSAETALVRVRLPRGGEARVSWPVACARQGEFALGDCFVQARSPLSLWAVRARRATGARVLVYPDAASEKNRIASLFLGKSFGVHAFRQVSKGREFEKLKDYETGDSLEDIHWKTAAKRRRPVTKVYQLERTQRVVALVDAGRLSARSAAGYSANDHAAPDPLAPLLWERFSTAALVLCMAAIRQGDLFGLGAFSDRMHFLVPPKGGPAQVNACREALVKVRPSPVSPDYHEAFSALAARITKRSLLVFFTCLDDAAVAENFEKNVALAAKKHLVLAASMVPSGARPLFSGPPRGLYADLAGLAFRELQAVRKRLQSRGADLLLVRSENLCPAVVDRYVSVKRRQKL